MDVIDDLVRERILEVAGAVVDIVARVMDDVKTKRDVAQDTAEIVRDVIQKIDRVDDLITVIVDNVDAGDAGDAGDAIGSIVFSELSLFDSLLDIDLLEEKKDNNEVIEETQIFKLDLSNCNPTITNSIITTNKNKKTKFQTKQIRQ